MKVLITGSAGLVGSAAVEFYCSQENMKVYGVDNNMRSTFFGPDGDVSWNIMRLINKYQNYLHKAADITNKVKMRNFFQKFGPFDLILHCAAQPSHDWAAQNPRVDFNVNAYGTFNMLEMLREYSKDAVFIFTSTNKVYGDTPNFLPLIEEETRWEIDKTHRYFNGIDESMSIDNSKHSIFGVSKVSADIMTQEYGKYFGLKTTTLRGGCLTGPNHSSAQLHGFLNYLAKCVLFDREFNIFGYKGKQVRDNIHSNDVVKAFDEVFKKPRCGEVYNIGGTRFSNISLIEAVKKIEVLSGKDAKLKYINTPRIGDHQWYISDMSKFFSHYPHYKLTYNIDMILKDIVDGLMRGVK
jgi:CDP-paratose 2-epimerase